MHSALQCDTHYHMTLNVQQWQRAYLQRDWSRGQMGKFTACHNSEHHPFLQKIWKFWEMQEIRPIFSLRQNAYFDWPAIRKHAFFRYASLTICAGANSNSFPIIDDWFCACMCVCVFVLTFKHFRGNNSGNHTFPYSRWLWGSIFSLVQRALFTSLTLGLNQWILICSDELLRWP